MPIDPVALAALLESEEGPVGQLVQRKATEVRDSARQYALRIMHRYPPIVDDINFEQSGTEAIVGIEDGGPGSISEYLADKEAFELVWLFPAVQDAFPAEG